MEDIPLAECIESAYVPPLETNQHPLQMQSRPQHALHAPVRQIRERTIDCLLASADPALHKRAEKLGFCGHSPTVRFEKGRLPVCLPGRCRDRVCPTCARFRARDLRRRLTPLLQRANSLRFITLSMPADARSLRDRTLALWSAFRSMRRTGIWKRHVRGGVALHESTTGTAGTHWHVHLHVLVEGTFFEHSLLKAAWSQAVGSEAICYIKPVHDRAGAARYVTKYITKGCDVEKWTDAQIREFATGMHRLRSVATFGTWHAQRLEKLDEENKPPTLPAREISYAALADAFDSGTLSHEKAAPLLSKLSATWRLLMQPYLSNATYIEAEPTPDDLADVTEFLCDFLDAHDAALDALAQDPEPRSRDAPITPMARLLPDSYR